MNDWTFDFAIKNAEHIRALGMESVYLRDGSEKPWGLVTRMQSGGSHRMDIDTTVRFYASHESGIEFTWSVDIERREANGKSSYYIDAAGMAGVAARLPKAPRDQFLRYLSNCAAKVREKGHEYLTTARNQYGDAAVLDSIVGGAVEQAEPATVADPPERDLEREADDAATARWEQAAGR